MVQSTLVEVAVHMKPEAAAPVHVVDMTIQSNPLFSGPMQHAVKEAVAQGGQAILFLNRRGFATLVTCSRCNHRVGCPHCSTKLVCGVSPRYLAPFARRSRRPPSPERRLETTGVGGRIR